MRIPRVLALLLVVLLPVAGCEQAGTTDDTPPSAGGGGAGKQQVTALLNELSVAEAGSMAGYSRDRFPHWSSQGNGCDTRDVVLKRDGANVVMTADCKITSGRWYSNYDDKWFDDPGDMDIDHMVPLAAAWRSGAAKWTDDQRKQFANDLTRPQLIAVSATTNRSKGDQDPSLWKPPNKGFWCEYVSRWVAVKHYWKLTVTAAEKTAILKMVEPCR